MKRLVPIFVICTLALVVMLAAGVLAGNKPADRPAGCCPGHAAAQAADAPAKAQTPGCDHVRAGHPDCDPAACNPAECVHADCDPAKCEHAKSVAAVKARAETIKAPPAGGCNPAACNPAMCDPAKFKQAHEAQQKADAEAKQRTKS